MRSIVNPILLKNIFSFLASLVFNSHNIPLHVYFTLLFSHTAPKYCDNPRVYSLCSLWSLLTPIDLTDFHVFNYLFWVDDSLIYIFRSSFYYFYSSIAIGTCEVSTGKLFHLTMKSHYKKCSIEGYKINEQRLKNEGSSVVT